MFRKWRIFFAALFIAGITLLFAGVGGNLWGWMAKLQLLPSVLAFNMVTVAAVLALTLLFGRLYCSVICPLGVFQDIVIALRRRFGGHLAYHHKREHKRIRYSIFAVFALLLAAGMQPLVLLVAPYSAYGRAMRAVFGIFDGSLTIPWWWISALAGISFIAVIAVFAWRGGREWCVTVCPVGTFLGFFSRFSLFRIRIDEDTCVKCGKCSHACRAFCIDVKSHTVDGSRCVGCFDCIDRCEFGAIRFSGPRRRKKTDTPDSGRRRFLFTSLFAAMGAGAAKAQEVHRDGALAPVMPKTNPERSGRLVPFGAVSEKNFYDKCTACQLCVASCPNGVLRPSSDLRHFLQPQMGYEKGWCRPECTACSEACPSGAILPVSPGEKLGIHIGTARVNLPLCVVVSDGVRCGNCARHCPTGAIRMVPLEDGSGSSVPSVNAELCIGCGACENLCPARPVSAITVDGLQKHRM